MSAKFSTEVLNLVRGQIYILVCVTQLYHVSTKFSTKFSTLRHGSAKFSMLATKFSSSTPGEFVTYRGGPAPLTN